MYTSGAYLFISLLFSLTIAAFITRFIYQWPWKNGSIKNNITERLLFILRVLALTFILLLLFNPTITHIKKSTIKPELIFLHDNSLSVKYLTDSAQLDRTHNILDAQKNKLKKQFNVREVYFDSKLTDEKPSNPFNGRVTDIAKAFKQVSKGAANPIAGVIMLSDGNYNRGENPAFTAQTLPFPVYSVRLGDTIAPKSIYIHNFYHNPVGYLHEQVPVEVDIRHEKIKNDSTLNISVLSDNGTLGSETVRIGKNQKRTQITLYFTPQKTGLQSFKLKIDDQKQSVRQFYMRINEEKQKVLLLYHAVHPDIGVIRRALEQTNRFEPVLRSAQNFKGNLNQYNLIVLHQIPSGNFAEDRWFAKAVEHEIPFWMILGPQSDYSTFNQGQEAFTITQRTGEFEEATVRSNEGFTWFKTSPILQKNVKEWPPLTVAFGQYQYNRGSSIFYQTLHDVNTERPAWLFVDQPYRFSVLAGTGLWRWKIYAYRQTGTHSIINELVYKTVKYLSLNQPKKRLILDYKQLYAASEPVTIEATWYNENYEPDNALPGELILEDSAGQDYNFAFNPTANRYLAKPGIMPSGQYQFEARFTRKNEIFKDTGKFVINKTNIERNSKLANVSLLQQISGPDRYFGTNQIPALADSLTNNPPLKSVRKTEQQITNWIDQKFLLFFIVLLLIAEWLLRKHTGKI